MLYDLIFKYHLLNIHKLAPQEIMAHVDGLRGRCTPGDAAVIDALRKLLSGDISKAEAHDVWTTAVADITTAPHAPAHCCTKQKKEGEKGRREE